MGNYMSGGTTIALYDTLGPDATKFVVSQTQLATIVCSKDLIENMVKLKQEDQENKMGSLTSIVSFESDVDQALLTQAESCGIKVTTLDEVI